MDNNGTLMKAHLCLDQALEHEQRGEFQEALRACDAALEIAPGVADAYNLRAVILEELGREREALEDYARAISLDPGFKEAVDNLLALERELGLSRDLVTVATFSHPFSAYPAQTKLEAGGIPTFLADETMILLYWLYSLALGGVKLQVMARDAKRALELLHEAAEPMDLPEHEQPRCPACNSQYTRYQRHSLRVAFASWLLLGVPIPFPKRRWKCSDCGHQWKREAPIC